MRSSRPKWSRSRIKPRIIPACTGWASPNLLDWARQEGQPYEAFLAGMAAGVLLGLFGTAEEFANVACFLASDPASYVTGTAINVDGNLYSVT